MAIKRIKSQYSELVLYDPFELKKIFPATLYKLPKKAYPENLFKIYRMHSTTFTFIPKNSWLHHGVLELWQHPVIYCVCLYGINPDKKEINLPLSIALIEIL